MPTPQRISGRRLSRLEPGCPPRLMRIALGATRKQALVRSGESAHSRERGTSTVASTEANSVVGCGLSTIPSAPSVSLRFETLFGQDCRQKKTDDTQKAVITDRGTVLALCPGSVFQENTMFPTPLTAFALASFMA